MTELIEANGLQFYVRDQGSGKPVVLLHGFPDTGDLWRHQVPALVKGGFRTIVPDMRGRGRSSKPQSVSDYRLSSIVRDTLGIWSTGDHYLTEEAMTRSERRLQGTWRYERVDGSHWVPVDQPDRLNRLLLDFLT